MLHNNKIDLLKKIFWDYDTDSLPLEQILNGKLDTINDYQRALIINRMLERLSWYDLLDILQIDTIKKILNEDTISRIKFPELRNKYEFLRKVLSGESVSFTGWGDEYYSKIKHTLFSNRWYSIKQTLL